MTNNTIGFNNFKAFGENIQTFSKKPITLIYGPNSIGKSSFLHSQLYLEYIRRGSMNLDLKETNFAGDMLSLGGFERFVHKREDNRAITYELTLTKEDDFQMLLPFDYKEIKKLEKEGFFENLYDVNAISNKLDETLNTHPFILKLILRVLFNEERIASLNSIAFFANVKEEIENIRLSNVKDRELLLLSYVVSNQAQVHDLYKYDLVTDKIIPTQELIDICEDSLNKTLEDFKLSKDLLESAIFLTKTTNPEEIVKIFDFFKYLSSIQTIKISIDLQHENKKIVSNIKLFIDNEIILSSIDRKSENTKFVYSVQSKFYKEACNLKDPKKVKLTSDGYAIPIGSEIAINFAPKSMLEAIFRPIMAFNYPKTPNGIIDLLRMKMISYLNNFDDKMIIQYFGPLRFYPERYDLSAKAEKKNHPELAEQNSALLLKSKWSIFWNLNKVFLALKNSNDFRDLLNPFLSNKNKYTIEGSYTSEQMWKEVIQSDELIAKLNGWLLDDTKLKSTYEVGVYNEVKKNGIFRKIFGLEKQVIKHLAFLDKRTSTIVWPREMGLGISQVLPILVSCLSSIKSKIFIEQPELHLHPKIQMEIVDEFIRSVKENGNEFFIETHSEHLLLRVMKRMRQTAEGKLEDQSLRLTPDDICLLYVNSNNERTYLNELELDYDGTLLDPWPGGFFEEGYNERFS